MSGLLNSIGGVSGILGTTAAPATGTGTDGYVLTATGAGVNPAWEAVATGLTGVTTGSGNVTITDGNLIVANGKGISFAATAEGAGITSDLFTDYEEGAWTPTHGTATFSTSNGFYNKIGRQVICPCHIIFSSSTASLGAFGGLPFTSRDDAIDPIGPAMTANIDFSGSGRTWCQSVVYANGTAWAIYSSGDANGVTSSQTSVSGQWSRFTMIYIT